MTSLKKKLLVGSSATALLGGGVVANEHFKTKKMNREMSSAIEEVLPGDLTDEERRTMVDSIVKGAGHKEGDGLSLSKKQVVELFKVAFGEQEFNVLVKQAADELAAEIIKQTADKK